MQYTKTGTFLISANSIVESDRTHSGLLRNIFKSFGNKKLTRLHSDPMWMNSNDLRIYVGIPRLTSIDRKTIEIENNTCDWKTIEIENNTCDWKTIEIEIQIY